MSDEKQVEEQPEIQAEWVALQEAYASDRPATTIVLASRFVTKYPNCGPAWKMLGTALVETANYLEAENALTAAIAFCPSDKLWIPLSEMGHMYRSRGLNRVAAAWYRKAIEAAPDEASPHIFLGGVLAKSGRLHEAEAEHRAATQSAKGCRDEAFFNQGLVLRATGDYQGASEAFREAIKIDPDYETAKAALADVTAAIEIVKP